MNIRGFYSWILLLVILIESTQILFGSEKDEDKDIAQTESQIIQETNRDFDQLQDTGTPIGEDGPIPIEPQYYDNNDDQY